MSNELVKPIVLLLAVAGLVVVVALPGGGGSSRVGGGGSADLVDTISTGEEVDVCGRLCEGAVHYGPNAPNPSGVSRPFTGISERA